MAWIVDNAILDHHEPIWLGATVLIVAGLLSFGGVYTRRYRGGQLSLDVQHDLRTELFASLERLDGARQDQLHTGQIVSRSISDLNMVQSLLAQMPMLLGNALLFVLSIAIMAYLSPLLTVVALAIAPALWLIAIASRRRLFPASWDAQQKEAEVAGVVDGAVTGVRVVKGFGQEEQEIGRLEGVATRLYSARVRVVRLTARYNPALEAVPMFGQVGVLALGGWLALHGSIKIGVFLAFSLYIGQLVSPVRALTTLITIGQEARASVIRVYEVIDAKPVVTEKPGAVDLPAGTPDVELDDVAFGYLPSQPVLRGLSLHVRPGETLAVVGTSGSGKSTISLLLPRFYDVRGGVIRVGGQDVRDLTLESLRASIGLVMEDSFLFSDTIRANICLRPARCDARADRRGGQGGGGRRVHHQPAGRLRHRHRRAGPHPVRRPAPAGVAGQGADHQPGDPDPGRRHLRHRRGDRGADPRHPAQGDGRAHHPADRAPPLDAPAGRPDRRPG